MSIFWDTLREDIVIADLATTDTDIEGLQVAPAAFDASFAVPAVWRGSSSEIVTRVAVMFLAYNGAAIVKSTATLQVIERSQDPKVVATAATGTVYAGHAPVASHPSGRLLDFDARYSHKFNVRVSSFVGVGATTLRILWRPFDSDR